MMTRRQVALDAAAKALALRRKLGYRISDSISPIDAAEKLGIDVRFVDFPSMEGMYISGGTSMILLSALRPPGRKHFTCAHEIGHHTYGHGDQLDKIVEELEEANDKDIKEYQVDTFASYFLMPKTAVQHALHVRGIDPVNLSPASVYALANCFGVGYVTLVQHLFYGLSAITNSKLSALRAVQPKQIREQLASSQSSKGVWIVDQHWSGRALDIEVGDTILAPPKCDAEGACIECFSEQERQRLIRGIAPGIARLALPDCDWAVFVRVSQKNFIGRSCFRFESED